MGGFCGLDNANLVSDSVLNAANAPPSAKNQVGKPFLYYINPINISNPYICVSSCPNKTEILTDPATFVCGYGTSATLSSATNLVNTGKCAPFTYASKPLLGRCVPSEPIPVNLYNSSITVAGQSVNVNELVSQASTFSIQAASELSTTWPIIAVAAAAAVVFTYIWILFVQFFVGIFVWLTILLSNVVSIAATAFLYLYWQNQKALQNAKITGNYNSLLANGTTIQFGSPNVNIDPSKFLPIKFCSERTGNPARRCRLSFAQKLIKNSLKSNMV